MGDLRVMNFHLDAISKMTNVTGADPAKLNSTPDTNAINKFLNLADSFCSEFNSSFKHDQLNTNANGNILSTRFQNKSSSFPNGNNAFEINVAQNKLNVNNTEILSERKDGLQISNSKSSQNMDIDRTIVSKDECKTTTSKRERYLRACSTKRNDIEYPSKVKCPSVDLKDKGQHTLKSTALGSQASQHRGRGKGGFSGKTWNKNQEKTDCNSINKLENGISESSTTIDCSNSDMLVSSNDSQAASAEDIYNKTRTCGTTHEESMDTVIVEPVLQTFNKTHCSTKTETNNNLTSEKHDQNHLNSNSFLINQGNENGNGRNVNLTNANEGEHTPSEGTVLLESGQLPEKDSSSTKQSEFNSNEADYISESNAECYESLPETSDDESGASDSEQSDTDEEEWSLPGFTVNRYWLDAVSKQIQEETDDFDQSVAEEKEINNYAKQRPKTMNCHETDQSNVDQSDKNSGIEMVQIEDNDHLHGVASCEDTNDSVENSDTETNNDMDVSKSLEISKLASSIAKFLESRSKSLPDDTDNLSGYDSTLTDDELPATNNKLDVKAGCAENHEMEVSRSKGSSQSPLLNRRKQDRLKRLHFPSVSHETNLPPIPATPDTLAPQKNFANVTIIVDDYDSEGNQIDSAERDNASACSDDSDDLEMLKAITTRLKLSTRRPSYQDWKAEYIDKPLIAKWRARRESLNSEAADEVQYSGNEDMEDRKDDVDKAIEWVKRELLEMRSRDQELARTLITLQHEIRRIKLQKSCSEHQEMLDDVAEEMEELDRGSFVDDVPSLLRINTTPLGQVGVTRMNLSRRRFSCC